MATCCHCLLHNTITMEEGDNIATVTFFVAKPLKKATMVTIIFLGSKAIEKGDGNCCHLFLLFKHKEKGNGSKLSSHLSL
jgi:hypothetical protein